MTPTQLARDALAGQLTPMDALARIAGMERTCGVPAITDAMVERCWHAYTTSRGSDLNAIRAVLDEFVRQTRPQEIRRATKQAARDAAMAAVVPKCKYCGTNHEQYGGCPAGRIDYDAHTTVYAQTADREAGGVAWGCGEPFDPRKSKEWQEGWRQALDIRCGRGRP